MIFITENDVLKGNKPIYHIDRIIRETGELFKDDTHIIYVNNEIKSDTPFMKAAGMDTSQVEKLDIK